LIKHKIAKNRVAVAKLLKKNTTKTNLRVVYPFVTQRPQGVDGVRLQVQNVGRFICL